eukprot:364429-Chlamydomonas_euryale.AAC.30
MMSHPTCLLWSLTLRPNVCTDCAPVAISPEDTAGQGKAWVSGSATENVVGQRSSAAAAAALDGGQHSHGVGV